MVSPHGIDLGQYRTQARELLTHLRTAQPDALERLRQHHPEHLTPATADRISLADAQLVIARENGFPSWTKFKEYLLFRNAVQALDIGDLPKLGALLDKHPALLRYHCHVGEWYEEGYFAGATLLNHIAGNPIRCPLPPNILDIARLLLSRGARDEASKPKYTIGLLLTSKQASEAGVALPLIDLLREAEGIELDLSAPDCLNSSIGEGAFGTAEELVWRGARMDIRHAAALGRLDTVQRLLDAGDSQSVDASLIPLPAEPDAAKLQKEEAFIRACQFGRTAVAAYLLDQGVDPGSLANSGQTGLHYAAHAGQLETVQMLLDRNAPLEVKNEYGGTVLGQAVWSALNEPRPDHLAIIERLLRAGANVDAVGYPTGNTAVDALLHQFGEKS